MNCDILIFEGKHKRIDYRKCTILVIESIYKYINIIRCQIWFLNIRVEEYKLSTLKMIYVYHSKFIV